MRWPSYAQSSGVLVYEEAPRSDATRSGMTPPDAGERCDKCQRSTSDDFAQERGVGGTGELHST
eukprot:4346642-Pyramimonas_sp.AAC.1